MTLGDVLQNGRRVLPVGRIPDRVRRQVDLLWQDPAYRAAQEMQMAHLLDHSSRAGEIPELAHRFAEQAMARRWLRWHPRAITRQPVRDVHLLTRRDPGRPAILSFMHHHRFDGMFGSLRRVGVVDMDILTLDWAMSAEASADVRQHIRVVRRGGPLLPSSGGSAAVRAALRPGRIVAMASDVASRTPVVFLGKPVLGSFGAARLAMETDSPVYPVTMVRDVPDDDRVIPPHHLQVHRPLDPRDHTDARDLLEEILRIQGEAVLAWPEALDQPKARFKVPESSQPREGSWS